MDANIGGNQGEKLGLTNASSIVVTACVEITNAHQLTQLNSSTIAGVERYLLIVGRFPQIHFY